MRMASNQRLIDLSGQRFGMWVVGRQSGNTKGGGALWLCRCDCGNERSVLGADLRKGKSISCGCKNTAALASSARTHGGSGSRLHMTWKNMRGRCNNPNRPGYENYGGRGISICPEWDSFAVFEQWANSVGYRAPLTLERMDVNGNYEPGNCMWAGPDTQSANRRFTKKAPDGELWWHKARKNGITRAAYNWRVAKGWPLPLVVTWPLGKRRVERDRNSAGQFS
jgi:hypothetical protein